MAQPIALRHQLFAALVLPAIAAIGATAYFADLAARDALEEALGDRLVSIAQAASTIVGPQVLVLERGEDDFRTKKNALQKLVALRDATGAARILIVRAERAEALVDTSLELAIGDEYARARFDRAELDDVLTGRGTSSVLFEGADGHPYKTGYAPLAAEDGKILGYAAVDGRASFFAAIGALRAALAVIAALGIALLAAMAVVSARRVSVPLSALAEAAARIGEGKLDTPIPTGGPREAFVLERAMRAMTSALAAREEEMQMMLAGIAHEVRNPLGGIELFGGLLREDLAEGDPRRKHVDKILKELGVLARVVNDFLDFARRTRAEPRSCDVRDLLEEVVALAARDAGASGVEITLEPGPGVGGRLEPDGIKRAVLNLIRNGIQAQPKGGRVLVRTREEEGRITIEVDDDGPGIPAERRAEIFAPFYTTKQKGTGLGLALVKKTVDAHSGRVTVSSSASSGARFTLELPSS